VKVYSKRERTLIGTVVPIPVLGVATLIVQRDTYAPWFWGVGVLLGVAVFAVSLKIVVTGTTWGRRKESGTPSPQSTDGGEG
jgi:hypothetical protein